MLIALAGAAFAEDDEEDYGFGDFDIDLDDIDLGGETAASTMTYSGGHTERSEKLDDNAAVTITHYGGPITVRCTDTEEVNARIDFVIEGTKEAPMQAVGDGIRLQAQGKGTWGKVSTIVPGSRSGVESITVPLVVSLPKQTRITVTARKGWISVSNCNGTVKAANTSGDIMVSGSYSQFNVRAPDGDVKVDLSADSSVTKSSGITASKGGATLVLPLSADVRLQATGGSVSVLHTVEGTNSGTNVSGNIGNGGPLLKVYGKEMVEITSP
ncbi:MAG TPA: DUF4097 family beta strand repeat-containing protein [Myxococcota bacterium]|nr:DUF4097 family beta strand repeat-containing protein [Myxococcota bacterium]